MSVVLRCPNCGTPQGHVGECDACSEGEVRYFCTNHDQGIWLDGPVCSHCNGRFGDAARSQAPPPSVPTRPSRAPDFHPPRRGRTPARPSGREWTRAETDAPIEAELAPRTPTLGELIEEMTEARARRARPSGMDATPWEPTPRRGIGFPIAGCLIRILGLGFLLFVALIIFLFVLFGGVVGR